jgi:hypothetical protein
MFNKMKGDNDMFLRSIQGTRAHNLLQMVVRWEITLSERKRSGGEKASGPPGQDVPYVQRL